MECELWFNRKVIQGLSGHEHGGSSSISHPPWIRYILTIPGAWQPLSSKETSSPQLMRMLTSVDLQLMNRPTKNTNGATSRKNNLRTGLL